VNNLLETLKNISSDLLRGQPVPDDLKRLWQSKLEGHDLTYPNLGFELIEEITPDLFIGYRLEDGVPASSVRGYQRMFDQIALFGKLEDGDLFGYWLGDPPRTVAESPVVRLDTEGQFSLVGMTASDAVLNQSVDDPEFPLERQFKTIRALFEASGIQNLPVKHDEIYAKCAPFSDPNETVDQFIAEEAARGST
jgi:hypothetical protein